jgi:hypothetical protein
MAATRYLVVFLAAFSLLIALAAADAWLQAGTPTRNGLYGCSYIRAKIARGLATPSPKLVIMGGSNTLAGIDTQLLANRLAIRAFNFGLSASFGPGFQIFEGAKVLKPGDAALLPLEYMAYDYETPKDSLVDTVYTCGTDYWRSLSWKEKLFFVLAVRPQRIIDSLLFRARPEAVKQTEELAARDVGPYGQRPGGNFPIHQVSIEAGLTNQPLAIRLDASSPGAAAIASFVAWAKAHRVVVLATWPNTILLPEGRAAFAKIRRFYGELGVAVVGAPQDAMLPAALMGDTFYHPNRYGMAVRTARLIALLDNDPAFSAWRSASVARNSEAH